MHCGTEKSANGKRFVWMNERNDRRYHPSDRRLVYSQHWLLFTGSRGHKTPIQLVVKSWWHQSRELCVQLSTLWAGFAIRVFKRAEQVLTFCKCSFQSSSSESNADNVTEKVYGTNFKTHFCHLHCGIHIKRSTFGYLLTSFWLKVRVFPYLGRAWVEQGKRLMI